jgi:HlyD family secretion protein
MSAENVSTLSAGVRALARQRVETFERQEIPLPPFRWMTRVFAPAAIALTALALFVSAAWNSLLPATRVEAISVVERSVEGRVRSAGTSVAQAAGWIEADPYLIYATALTDGVVREVLVLEGDRVEAGQVVARLVDEDARLALRRAEAEAADREAMLAETQAQLVAAQADWDNPVERERAVAVTQAKLIETQAALRQLEDEIASAAADAERLRSDHRRIASLGNSQSVSESEVVTARTRMQAQEATLESFRRRREVIQAQIVREEAELRAAQENQRLRTPERLALEVARAAAARAQAELDNARAALDEARLRVERLEVKSPAAGVVVERFKEPGSKSMLGMDDEFSATMVSLYDPAKLQVRVDIPLVDAASVAVGQRAEIVADVLPERTFAGHVTRLLHVADIQKNTLQAKVAIDNPSPMLRPEMLARVRFLAAEPAPSDDASENAQAIFAPEGALRGGQAWVVDGYDGTHGRAKLRSVALGSARLEHWAEVREGLLPGDLILPAPPPGLSDGQRVRVSFAASRQGGGF